MLEPGLNGCRLFIVPRTYPRNAAVRKSRYGICPTCKAFGRFILLGEQNWPPALAQELGVPSKILLWRCPHCCTTVSDPDLLPLKPAVISASLRDHWLR